MSLKNEYENLYWSKGETVLGIDEVGRGPICGPLVVAGVVLPINYVNDEIKDSKKLSSKKIEALYHVIIDNAIRYKIDIVDPKTIDELNIYQATKSSMERIASSCEAAYIITDAMPIDINKEYSKIIKGDSLSISIAAASIIAKYTRDQIMLEYDLLYPEYGYKNHKGYPTSKHLQAIKIYGIKDFYRLSYKPCKNL